VPRLPVVGGPLWVFELRAVRENGAGAIHLLLQVSDGGSGVVMNRSVFQYKTLEIIVNVSISKQANTL
jgi:hypothetical protein